MAAEQAKSLFNRITRAHYSEFQNPTTGNSPASAQNQGGPTSYYQDDEDQFNEDDQYHNRWVYSFTYSRHVKLHSYAVVLKLDYQKTKDLQFFDRPLITKKQRQLITKKLGAPHTSHYSKWDWKFQIWTRI